MPIIRYIYDKMLILSANPKAMWFLALVAFAESSFFPIPPDIMLIPMVLAMPQKAWKIAGLATVSSVVGGYFGYGIGVFFFDVIAKPILAFYGYTFLDSIEQLWGEMTEEHLRDIDIVVRNLSGIIREKLKSRK